MAHEARRKRDQEKGLVAVLEKVTFYSICKHHSNCHEVYLCIIRI